MMWWVKSFSIIPHLRMNNGPFALQTKFWSKQV
jgi:hypothetical protein